MFDNSPVGIALVAPEGQIKEGNAALLQTLGYSADELVSKKIRDITHPDDFAQELTLIEEVLSGSRDTYTVEKRLLRKDGQEVWGRVSSAVVRNTDGSVRFAFGMVEDITRRKEAESEINRYQQRLKALVSQMTIAEERERHRIATDLHDHIGQSLALARMQLDGVLKTAPPVETSMLINDISNILLKTIQDSKDLIFELSSLSIHKVGLAAAISEWLEEYFGIRYDLETEVIDQTNDLHLNPDLRSVLFRNVRELLINVIKHASAKKVSVRLEDSPQTLKITVADDGVGFDPKEPKTGAKRGGFGLFSIQERMADLGGSLEIISAPGQGSKLILTAPIS
jgi:PAS domain S-box-containing protein